MGCDIIQFASKSLVLFVFFAESNSELLAGVIKGSALLAVFCFQQAFSRPEILCW
jgi:hypothetical protein